MTACGFNPCFEKACKVDFTARCVTDAECRPTFISKTERILDECVGNKLVCFVIPHRWISGPVVTISLELEIGIRLPPPSFGDSHIIVMGVIVMAIVLPFLFKSIVARYHLECIN